MPAIADDRALRIQGSLPGEVDGGAAGDPHGVREAGGLAQLDRVHVFDLKNVASHDCTAPPSTLMPCPVTAPLTTQKCTASATSAGSMSRPMGCLRARSC